MLKRLVVLAVLSTALVAQNPSSPASAVPNFDGKSWWDYVKVLADDNMEGRETGSEGFYQPVKLISRQIDESASSLTLVRNGKDEPLVLGQDAMFSTRVDLAPEVDAPLVFVGYGLSVPEKDYDDFAGLDLKGKVAVMISGS